MTLSISLLLHRSELRRRSNTGRLLLSAPLPCHHVIYGRRHNPLDMGQLTQPGRSNLMLFPLGGEQDIREFSGGDCHLIIPDGTWNQAARMARKIKLELAEKITCVSLPALPAAVSPFRVRKQPQATHVNTIEAAIAAIHWLAPQLDLQAVWEEYLSERDTQLRMRGRPCPEPTQTDPSPATWWQSSHNQ